MIDTLQAARVEAHVGAQTNLLLNIRSCARWLVFFAGVATFFQVATWAEVAYR